MFKKILLFIAFLVLFNHSFQAQKVGLVLSGGGAKGAVHIGIIAALEENEIPIDYVAGTSIGAIVGSLYAMGYSPEQMLELFLSEDFYHWQTGKVEEDFQFYFRKRRDEPDFMRVNIPLKDSIDIKNAILPNSLINPIQMNQAFVQMFAQATAQSRGNFDDLFVPFLCVASDVYNKKPMIFRNGDLGNAVRASMSFPFVFKPILQDSIPLFDGGIYDNFPVNPMKEAWNPDFIIGSSVAGTNTKKPIDQSAYEQIENMIMHQTEYNVDPEDGIMMKFKLDDVSLLDFNKSKALYELGYNTTIEMIDSIKNRINVQIPLEQVDVNRAKYKASLPELRFKNIYITGATDAQKEYIEHQLNREEKEYFSFNDFKRAYFRLLSNEKIKEITPRAVYDSQNESFDLYLDIAIKDEVSIALGGNISSMSANQIYLGLSYQSLAELSSRISVDMQLGNTYNGFSMEGKVELPTKMPMDISALFVHNNRKFYESEKLFIDTDLLSFIHQKEFFGRIGVGLPFQSKAKLELLLAYGQLEDKYYLSNNSSFIGTPFDKSRYNLFNAGIYYRKNSLDAKQYPILGHNHQLYAQFITGKEHFNPASDDLPNASTHQSYIQINASLNNYHSMSEKFNLGYIVEGVVSSKNLWQNYTASILQAPAFTPTPHSLLIFNEAFRSNQYLAGGIIPIYKLSSIFHLRGDFYVFSPLYPIKRVDDNKAEYGKFFSERSYLGELSLIARFPFLTVSLFANRYSYPNDNWNFGLNIGYLIFGPKFIP